MQVKRGVDVYFHLDAFFSFTVRLGSILFVLNSSKSVWGMKLRLVFGARLQGT